jgi:hypothetical protein
MTDVTHATIAIETLIFQYREDDFSHRTISLDTSFRFPL